jgi:adenylylsulfate kinase-like enzyme
MRRTEAHQGRIKKFHRTDSLYEAPQVPDIHVAGLDETPEATAARIADWSVAHQGANTLTDAKLSGTVTLKIRTSAE